MTGQADKLPTLAGIPPQQLWYVPDRRLRTETAAREAIAVQERIALGDESREELDERTLFVAMHTCAFRAVRRPADKHIPRSERERWARRWRVIREHVVQRNLGLAYSMIARFGHTQLDEDDLLSDAMLGLTRAVDRFNPWKGYRFSTYACNVIARALMRRGKRERVYRRVFPVQYDTSFEQPGDAPDHESALFVERLQRILDANLGELTDIESRVLAKRFTQDHTTRLTFEEIGETVGLSKERVRQIQNIALRKLRTVLLEDPVIQQDRGGTGLGVLEGEMQGTGEGAAKTRIGERGGGSFTLHVYRLRGVGGVSR